MKLLTIVGARPQFVKAAAFSFCLKKYHQIKEVIVHTGQHYDANMSDIFFDQLGIPKPDYRLESGGKAHGEMTGYQLAAIEKILIKEQPDWVIVYGDTNSTLAGALAARWCLGFPSCGSGFTFMVRFPARFYVLESSTV